MSKKNWWDWRKATWDALAAGELTQSEFIILDFLWERADGNDRAFVGHSQIARCTGIGREWVITCTKNLKARGWFEQRKRKIARGHSYTFTLTMPSEARARAKWAEIRKALKGELGSNDFDSFFGQSAADVDEAAKTLTLRTPDEFTTMWVADNWFDLLEDTAKEHGITTVSIITNAQ